MTQEQTKEYLEWLERNKPAMEAHAQGEPIEYKLHGAWSITEAPLWLVIYEYRVKPAPREFWVSIFSDYKEVYCTESEAKSVQDISSFIETIHVKEA